MAKLDILAGATSVSLAVFISDSSSTTGQGLAGLVYNTSGLIAYSVVPGASAAAITLATLAAANSAWSSGGFKEIDATNMKGWYRFDVPNAVIASGRSVGIHFSGAANMAPLPLEISLTAVNNQSTGFGLVDVSANVVKLLGTAWLTPGTAGTPDVNVKLWNALTTVALPLVPTTAGRTLDVSAGGEGGVDWANVGSPTTAVDLSGTTIKTTQKVDVDTIKANPVVNGGTITFPTNKTLADTTSAVGSVTGNVGGNVTGSVGSVVGAVGSVTGAVGSVTGAVGSVAAGGIAASSFAAGAVDASAIAANAIGASEIAADAIGSSQLAATAANEIRDAIFARAFSAAYGSLTFDQIMSVTIAVLAGKLSGAATTTVTIRNLADGADVVVATVDAAGNRSAVTITP